MIKLSAEEYVNIALGKLSNSNLKMINKEIVSDTDNLSIIRFTFNDVTTMEDSLVTGKNNIM